MGMLVRDGSVDRTRRAPGGTPSRRSAMKQQAELALADLPVTPAPLRVVGAAGTASLDAATAPVATIHTLSPAIHHVQVDRSARCRARDLWAATKRAAELSRGQTASRLWSRRWSRQAAQLTGPAALIPADNFAAYLAEAERAFPGDSPADLLSRIRNTYYSGFLVSQLLPDARAHGGRTLHGNPRLGRTAHRHLTARADENGVGDNPSPYVLLRSGEQVDIGHLFLGLEALLHPRTTVPFSTY